MRSTFSFLSGFVFLAACGGPAESLDDTPARAPADTSSTDSPALPSPNAGRKTVFVTSGLYRADLGGIAGADAKCQDEAKAAGLAGTYLAWLSTAEANAASRFDHGSGPFVLTTGDVVAADWNALVSENDLAHAIDRTATREEPIPSRGVTFCSGNLVWTGTRANGDFSGGDCSGWTSAGATGFVSLGIAGLTSSRWTDWCYENACTLEAHLYCIEK